MKLAWMILFILFFFSAWMFFTPYPVGGGFCWEIEGIHQGAVSDREASFFYFMREKFILRLAQNYALELTGFAGAEGPWRVINSGEGVWQIWKGLQFWGEYKEEGIPFFKGGRLFHIVSDNTVLKEISLEKGRAGYLLWEKTLPSSLISFSSLSGLSALGFSMGEVWLLDAQGNLIMNLNYAKKKDALVTGVSLANYGSKNYLAVLEGWENSYWHLYEQERGSFLREIALGEAGESLKREARLVFDSKEPILFVEKEKGILIYSIKKGKAEDLPRQGILIDAFHHPFGVDYILSFLPYGGKIILQEVFKSEILNSWQWQGSKFIQWALNDRGVFWLDFSSPHAWFLKRG